MSRLIKVIHLGTALLLFLSINVCYSQKNGPIKGVVWSSETSWESVKRTAKKEKRYIFVDAYATWCGPCRAMDKLVFSDSLIGRAVAEKFLAVKIQMDTAKSDDVHTKDWYADARSFRENYGVYGYPTYMFFTPDGKLVHRVMGFRDVKEFGGILSDVADPKKQFYTLLDQYKKGKKNYSQLPYMIEVASQIAERSWEQSLARDYIDNYLYQQDTSKLYNREAVLLIATYMQSSNEKGFAMFLNHPDRVNGLFGLTAYAQSIVQKIIDKEEIKPRIATVANGGEPDWNGIANSIKDKYTAQLAGRAVLDAKLRWTGDRQDWGKLAELHIEKISRYGLDTIGLAKDFTNNMIWRVFFLHCNDRDQLGKAKQWMEVIIKADPYNPNNIDTYANLLYKLGLVSEAMKWQEIAIKLSPENNGMAGALVKMRKMEPTYIELGAIWTKETYPKTK